jgi:hypothetical protein
MVKMEKFASIYVAAKNRKEAKSRQKHVLLIIFGQLSEYKKYIPLLTSYAEVKNLYFTKYDD